MSNGTATPAQVNVVGLVGAGRMGGQIGRHLRTHGWQVVVCDPSPDAQTAMTDLGATVATGIADLSRTADLILVTVVDDAQVRDVIAGRDGILAAARDGTIIAICASVKPETCKDLAAAAAARGVHVIDVALVHGERGAEQGDLTLLCGGPDDVLAACGPAFAAFATFVSRVGPVGAGQAAKIANNLLMWACIAVDVDALRLGRALGVQPGRMRSVLSVGSGGNRVLTDWGVHRLRWPHKDLEVALEVAERAGVDMPMVRKLPEIFAELSFDDLVDLR